MKEIGTGLWVRGLSVTFRGDRGDVPAVRGVDLDVPRGRVVALLGESGCGKSVTARAIMGLAGPTAEVAAYELRLGDHDLLGGGEPALRRLRGRRMSLVLQDALSALNPVLTVGDQLGELFRIHAGASRRAARARAVDLLGTLGIAAPGRRVDEFPHQLSGGMRQRILIAMAIAMEPELIIADEPTTALDVTVQAQILELLDRLRRRLDLGLLLITHDLGVVTELADDLAVMYAGRIVERGDADAVTTRPAHPYTEALLRAAPRMGRRGERLVTIAGAPPDPAAAPPGCPFHPRCPRAIEVCRAVTPEPVPVGAGRTARCHRAEVLVDGP